jgi:hypothetical protein
MSNNVVKFERHPSVFLEPFVFFRRKFMWKTFLGLLGILILSLGISGYFYAPKAWDSWIGPADQAFAPDAIRAKLATGSLLYYRDQKTVLAAMDKGAERQYVPISQIPQFLIHAVLSAEDERFFEHPGFDWRGITRAAWTNLWAGEVVMGGSTITQQTAKNLFGREERSFAAKWLELKQALKLEHHYSKYQILEFYLNQFHVAGIGRGAGLAGLYYFQKPLHQLNQHELLFVAASLQGPSLFDPFRQKDSQAQKHASQRAQNRMAWILGRMQALNYLDSLQTQQILQQPLRFQQGKLDRKSHFAYKWIWEGILSKIHSAQVQDSALWDCLANEEIEPCALYTHLDHSWQNWADSLTSQTPSLRVLIIDKDGVLGLSEAQNSGPIPPLNPIKKEVLNWFWALKNQSDSNLEYHKYLSQKTDSNNWLQLLREAQILMPQEGIASLPVKATWIEYSPQKLTESRFYQQRDLMIQKLWESGRTSEAMALSQIPLLNKKKTDSTLNFHQADSLITAHFAGTVLAWLSPSGQHNLWLQAPENAVIASKRDSNATWIESKIHWTVFKELKDNWLQSINDVGYRSWKDHALHPSLMDSLSVFWQRQMYHPSPYPTTGEFAEMHELINLMETWLPFFQDNRQLDPIYALQALRNSKNQNFYWRAPNINHAILSRFTPRVLNSSHMSPEPNKPCLDFYFKQFKSPTDGHLTWLQPKNNPKVWILFWNAPAHEETFQKNLKQHALAHPFQSGLPLCPIP